MVTELCRARRVQGGLAIWINKEAPPSGLEGPFDLAFVGDYDEVAALLSP